MTSCQLDLFSQPDPAPAPPEPIREPEPEPEPTVEAAEPGQIGLFGDAPLPQPEDDGAPLRTIYVHFEDREGLEAFRELIGQHVTTETRTIWYPADVIFKGARKFLK